jgi:hypothetical protein
VPAPQSSPPSASATIARLILLVPTPRSTNVIGTSSTAQAAADGALRQVDLEAVALRGDVVQVELLERRPAERAVAAGGVAQVDAEREPRVRGCRRG